DPPFLYLTRRALLASFKACPIRSARNNPIISPGEKILDIPSSETLPYRRLWQAIDRLDLELVLEGSKKRRD
ncbi:hypothetical protein HAX54_032165, partial [Datura stramonium]|nr:hypothetical protein [Datura stramonium]